MNGALGVAATIAFALFWLGLGSFFGVRFGERRLLKRIRNAPPPTPTAAHLGNTVARRPQRADESS